MKNRDVSIAVRKQERQQEFISLDNPQLAALIWHKGAPADIRKTRYLLRHKSITSTQSYTYVNPTELKRIVDCIAF